MLALECVPSTAGKPRFRTFHRALVGLPTVPARRTQVAAQARDAVAKALYSALFDWLVEKINLTLTAAMNSKASGDRASNRCVSQM